MLRSKLTEVLGEREAAVLMESVPPMRYEELATKDDLTREIGALRAEFRGDGAQLRGEFAELRGEMAQLRGDVTLQMAKQLRVTVLTHVGSMLGLAAFLTALN